MNKLQIKLIVVLMSISLAGIIVVQYFWIRNAISVKERQFDNSVNTAMTNIVKRLDRFHSLEIITSDILKQNPKDSIFMANIDKPEFVYHYKLPDSTTKQIAVKGKYSIDPKTAENQILILNEANRLYAAQKAAKIKTESYVYNASDGSITISIDDSDKEVKIDTLVFQENKKKQEIIRHRLHSINTTLQQLAVEFTFTEDILLNRLNIEEISPIIKSELNENKLPLNYEFAIIDSDSTKKIKTDGFPNELNDSKYKTNLFPKDFQQRNNYLLLIFPEKTRHIFRSVILLLSGSVLFTLIILITFTITIMIILKQKKVSEIKTDFINNMTHEFKTPIATISLAVDSINSPSIITKQDQIRNYTNIIKEENQRMNAQVENVLQMSLIDKKDLELNLQELDIHPLIERAVKNIKLHVDKRNGELNIDLTAQNTNFWVDENHFINVIQNILENANKYSTESPQINLKTENAKNGILIKVSDQGIGMSKDTLDKIFDKFYRVPTGNIHNIKGFGLGLSYVKAIVQAFNGNVKAESELNKGSIFTIFLPYKK